MRWERSVERMRRGSVRGRVLVLRRGFKAGLAAAPLSVGDEGRVLVGDITFTNSSSLSLSGKEFARRRLYNRLMVVEERNFIARQR
jgi:hypothetical protein